MQPVVTSKILIYFSFFFPRFWVIYYFFLFFVSFKLCCRCFINWFTFTFRRRLPADASAARPSLDFVRNFSKNSCVFYFHWRRPRVHSSRHQHQRRLWVSFDDQIFWQFHYVCVCVSVWTDMYVVCACRYLWKRDAFDFWFRFGLTFLCVCVLSWFFFFSLLSVYLTYSLTCIWTHVYDNLCM